MSHCKTARNSVAADVARPGFGEGPTGFSLLEMMVSLVVLLIVMSIVMSGMAQLTAGQGTIVNRTEMHRSVRGATELLQQEVGQAGRISLPATVALSAAASASSSAESVAVSSTAGMYVGMYLDVLPDTAASAITRPSS